MVTKQPCRFYRTPAGCRQGDKCKYSHIDPATPGSSSAAGSNAAPGSRAGTSQAGPSGGRSITTSTSRSNTSALVPNLPRGACRVFWTSGRCPHGEGCKFNHIVNSSNPPPPEAFVSLKSHFEAAGLGSFPSLETDKFAAGTGTNGTPGETHHFLKKFLEDSFRFQTPSQVYSFLDLVCNANTENPNWTPEDGYSHLHNLAKGNGVLRLGDAIRFPEASPNGSWSFQRGYIPLLTYLSSEWVIKSTIHADVNMLYGLIHTNFDVLRKTIQAHMIRLMQNRSFKEPGRKPLSGTHVFKVLFTVLFEYLTRFKNVSFTNPEVSELVQQCANWFDEWSLALGPPPSFDDDCTTYEENIKAFIVKNLNQNKLQVLKIVEREHARLAKPAKRVVQTGPVSSEALIANLQRICDFDGPGELRDKGPRHDNDHASIEDIRIAPTHQELICEDDPYLPPNFPEAPHFLEQKSVERLLDTQFRLLREELIAPIRLAIQLVVSDLQKPSGSDTFLSKLIKSQGGRYAAPANVQESVIFGVFTNVTFEPLKLNNRGTSVGIAFDAPPGKARHKQAAVRATYWEQVAKKRLMQGGLVALIWKDVSNSLDVYIGTVASSPKDLVDSAKKQEDRVSLRVSFFDTSAELRIIRALQNRHGLTGTQILIEAPVFYEGIRPFLEALKKSPDFLPFSQYLCHQSIEELRNQPIGPPSYSLTPRFAFQLKDLFPPESGVGSLALTTTSADSITRARQELTRASRLDPSQAEAVVDCLTREVCLIQGPPGTGKSYTGLEIIRVLIKNNVQPILLVAFTNHALDHMLKGVLDAKITTNIVRLGSRHAADERIMEFSLENAEKLQNKSRMDRTINAAYREMKSTETEMITLMNKLATQDVPQEHLENCLLAEYPFHYDELFSSPPSWIWTLVSQAVFGQDPVSGEEGVWQTVGDAPTDVSVLTFWRTGSDIAFLQPPPTIQHPPAPPQQAISGSNRFGLLQENRTAREPDLIRQHREFILEFMHQHEFDEVPVVPQTARSLDALLSDHRVWNMSMSERATLYDTWYMTASEAIRQSQVQDFENLRQKHTDALRRFQEIQDQNRVTLLKRAHIVGCTTTGAAKVVSLLSGMQPKVMIVEEAGQVLESHILASLVQSVEQIVMIGDPLQLRPNLNNYKLSVENRTTGRIYRFDLSLMERLSSSGFPMSRLDVQRRMRPEISSLIRNTLYPQLEDHTRVMEYPSVRGMHKNVFFVSHANREAGGGEDSVSKHNAYEIDMMHDLVLHLLKQGCYNSPKDIVILTAYLGQIPKIRKRLQDVVTTVVDERDAELLEQHGVEDEEVTIVQQVQASSRVLIRTLDNFQGEEGKIIILSLVRNNGTKFDGNASSLQHSPGARSHIGFLKSNNRVNVGLSRAKHGLYVFGNAPELAHGSNMWATVLQELHTNESVGQGIPISCSRHPEYVRWVDKPGMISIVSPDGGCLEPCAAMLPCGHQCPFKCHADDPNHIATKCNERCLKLCPSSHPCDRRCFECSKGCGDCRFPVRNVQLPCGHTHSSAPCYLSRLPEKIKCSKTVKKKLPSCEHSANMPCHQDPATCFCTEVCGMGYSCCSRSCKESCGNCQKLNTAADDQAVIPRLVHLPHQCGRRLFCGHECKDECEEGHQCSGSCDQQCRQVCPHHTCPKSCSAPCHPCIKKCSWKCSHVECPSTCGMPCTRLPCDQKCPNTLKCGHPCPSVCGEPCERQTCRNCASDDTLDAVVDLIMHTSLRDLEDESSLDSMTITLSCGHIFTVETLDGITHLGDFYSRDSTTMKWLSAITPETHGESRTRPVCPTCRGDITALRYGRICKASNLAIMQHNVSSKLSKSLTRAEAGVDKALENLEASITSSAGKCEPYVPMGSDTELASKDKLDILLQKQPNCPTPPLALENLTEYHAIPPNHNNAWRGAIKNVLVPYRQAFLVSNHRDSTIQTYEATLATLFQEEMDYFLRTPNRIPADTEQSALRLARMRIGQPPPRASLRFVVEAFWMTIRVLIALAEAAVQASKAVRSRDSTTDNCSPWLKIAEFLLERAVHDSQVALAIAEGSESWNKAAKCQVIAMQARFELASYQCRTAIEHGKLTSDKQKMLSSLCSRAYADDIALRKKVVRDDLAHWGLGERSARVQWLDANFMAPTSPIMESWQELKRSVDNGSWYSSVSREENRSIMRALMEGSDRLSHTGHFYECINGHPYVIGECGGAMQQSRCPECGTPIGGAHHQATAGNTHSRRFLDIAREERVQESPWQWGPGGR